MNKCIILVLAVGLSITAQAKNHLYNSRTGTSGNYTYNYDVMGDTSGNCNMTGKYGTCTVEKNGEEVEVDAQWNGYGQIEATDEEGQTYQLQTY